VVKQGSPFFQKFDEVGDDPRKVVARPSVFPNTEALTLDRVDQPWVRWDGGSLADSGVEIWRVQSTGHQSIWSGQTAGVTTFPSAAA
jgi:hypothetical protein